MLRPIADIDLHRQGHQCFMPVATNAENDYQLCFHVLSDEGRAWPATCDHSDRFSCARAFLVCSSGQSVLPTCQRQLSTAAVNMCSAKVEQDPLLQLGGSCLCVVRRASPDVEHRTSGLSINARYYSLNNEPRTVASSFLLPFALVDPDSDQPEAFNLTIRLRHSLSGGAPKQREPSALTVSLHPRPSRFRPSKMQSTRFSWTATSRHLSAVRTCSNREVLQPRQPPQLQVLFAGLLNQPHVFGAR